MKFNGIVNFIGNVTKLPIYLLHLVKRLLYPPRFTYGELVDGMNWITASSQLCISEQNKQKVLYLKVKETVRNVCLNHLNPLTLSQIEQVDDALKSVCAANRIADKTDAFILKLEEVLGSMSSEINLHFPENKELIDALKENTKFLELYTAGITTIKSICVETNALLDIISSQDSSQDFRDKESNIRDMNFITASLELGLSEQNKRKMFFSEIKETVESISKYHHNPPTLSEKEHVADLAKLVTKANSLVDMPDSLSLNFERVLCTMSSKINLHFPANKELNDALKKNIKSFELYSAEKLAIKTICVETNAILDKILSQDSRLGHRESNTGDDGFMDENNTEAP